MFSKNLRIFLSEITLVSLIIQISFPSISNTYAVNPGIHETIQTHSATMGYSFTMSGTTYLAIGNGNTSSGAEIRAVSSTGASSLIQDLPDNAEAFQYFSISGESYLAVGNRLSNDEIYRFDGSSFTGFQTLPSDIYASDFAFIDQSGSYLLAVSNQSPTSPSQIFQWTGTGFDFSYNLGEVTSHSAIESFQIRDFARESYPYAQIMADNSIIASQSSFTGYRLEETMTKAELIKLAANLGAIAPVPCTETIFSDVNNSLGDFCGYIEAFADANIIPTSSATFSPYSLVDRGEAIGILVKVLGEAPSSGINGLSYFYDNYQHPYAGYINRAKEIGCTDNGHYFYSYEKAKRGDVFKFAVCLSGLDIAISSILPLPVDQYTGEYLALSDGKIYKTDATGATLIQSLPISGPSDIKFMNIRGDQILGFLDHGSSGLLFYKWDGTQFVQFQRIQLSTSGGVKLSFDAFTSEANISDGKSYIILPLGDSDRSGLYVYQDGQFELAQYISNTSLGALDMHSDWKYFTVDGIPFLFLANRFNTTNSAIYNYLPPPYVVIKSPTSGESNNYREWNPASTPITGVGSPTTHIMIYDGAGTNIGSGVVNVSGEFSILTSANSESVLPIRVVPYTYFLGEEKTIDYVHIPKPAPTPTSSHDSKVYRDPFIFSISGETSFYTVSGEDKIRYDVYKNNIFSVSGEVNGYGVDITVSGEDTSIQYYGKNNSGATTAVQSRDFVYDSIVPSASPAWANNFIVGGWDTSAFLPAGLEVKSSPYYPVSHHVYGFSDQAIGRFSLVAHQDAIRIQNMTIQANIVGVSTGMTLESFVVNSTGSVQLFNIDTNIQIPATASISGNTLSFSGMNHIIQNNSTENYTVILSMGDLHNYYGATITLDSPVVSSVFDITNQPAPFTGTATLDTYPFSIILPSVTLSKKTDNTFLVSITNINTSQDIVLNSITTFVNSASALGNYTATICMRDEGSTDTCSIATSTGSIPGAPKKFSTPILIPKNSTITREIYVDSPFMSPTDLQIEIQDLDYTPGGLYSHEYWLCTGSLCQSKGPSLPEVFDNPSVLFFVTGSIVQLSLYHYDNTANFSATGMNLLMPTPPILSSGLVSNFFSGMYGGGIEISGDLSLSGGRRDIKYSLTDLMENRVNASFSIYRLPDLSQPVIFHTGGIAYYRFSSDMSAPVEYSYTQGITTYSGTIQAMSGANTITLTGTSLTGSISGEVRIAKNLPDIIVPDSVQEATKQIATYSFDPYPDVFTFTKKLGVTPGSQVQFGPITLTGFNVPTTIRTTKGTLDVNGQLFGTASTIVSPGSIISIYVQAESTYNSVSSGSLIIGSGTSVIFEIENSLAPTLSITPPGPGGGGGSSSSQGTSTSSQGQNSAANSLNPLYQGLNLMNVFLQRSLGTIQTLILPPKLEIPPQGASIKEISKIAYRDLVEPVLQEALKKQTIPESIDRVDQGVKDYSLKMKETKINSPEYKAYRSARKELFSLRKEFIKDMKK